MKRDKNITEVIFRVWRNQIITLFPHIVCDFNGSVLSYMHLGQHGAANYDHIIKESKLAAEKEYIDLYNELTNHFGYNLKVMKKRNYNKYLKDYYRVRGIVS